MHVYTPTHVDANTSTTPLGPIEELKTPFNEIIEAIPLITYPMYYETKIVLLQIEELRQELKDAASNYKAATHNMRKLLL